MNRLQKYHRINLRQEMALRGNAQNVHEVPTIKKIVLNLGMKEVIKEKKRILIPLLAMEAITGQKAAITRSKKMVATLKIRKDMIIGCKVTLRGKELFSFLDRLNTIVFPRIKQFKGFQLNSINESGNISFRVLNLLDFMELERQYELFEDLFFLDITLVTTNKLKEESLAMLSGLQLPFSQE